MNMIQRDAENELNSRTRGREARLARLRDAGWPTEREALRRRLEDELNAQHEAAGGVFHCCTARVKNGVDRDLPARDGVGCRITRVPITATLITEDEDGEERDESEWYWSVSGGVVGVGSMGCSTVMFGASGDSSHECATAEEAEAYARERLLAGGECVRTYAEARALCVEMLARRVGAPPRRS